MNREQFLNKEIINKDNERGYVISFDNEHIIVKYQNEEITYSADGVFEIRYLSFTDENLNLLIEEYLSSKNQLDQQREKEVEDNHKIAITRYKKVNELYEKLFNKNRVMKALFGRDFIYPPFAEFEKKYRWYIAKSSVFKSYLNETYNR